MLQLRRPIPTLAVLSLGLAACNDDTPFIPYSDTGGGGTDTGGGGTDTGVADAGSDSSGVDVGAPDTSRPDAGGPDAIETDATPPFDTGGPDSDPGDAGPPDDVGPGTVDPAVWEELINAWCTNAAECYPDETDFTANCIAESEAYSGEIEEDLAAYGQDCLDAYIAYLRCGADNLVCYDDGEYSGAQIDGCEAELDVIYASCDFDGYEP